MGHALCLWYFGPFALSSTSIKLSPLQNLYRPFDSSYEITFGGRVAWANGVRKPARRILGWSQEGFVYHETYFVYTNFQLLSSTQHFNLKLAYYFVATKAMHIVFLLAIIQTKLKIGVLKTIIFIAELRRRNWIKSLD
jgi:hypothetical protein